MIGYNPAPDLFIFFVREIKKLVSSVQTFFLLLCNYVIKIVNTLKNTPTSTHEKCPCGRANECNLERTPRNAWQRLFLFFLPLKRYRCYYCHKKFLRLD
jgi:hypothetical protein